VAQLEDDLRQLLRDGTAGAAPLGPAGLGAARLERARRAAAYLAAHAAELRARGLLAFGEKPGDVHLAPPLEDALEEALGPGAA
jgi:hypothetical protein